MNLTTLFIGPPLSWSETGYNLRGELGGARFAEMSAASEAAARQLQQHMSRCTRASDFMPGIDA